MEDRKLLAEIEGSSRIAKEGLKHAASCYFQPPRGVPYGRKKNNVEFTHY